MEVQPWYEKVRNSLCDIIEYIGDDPNREGLIETPDRVIKSWQTFFGGYNKNPAEVMKVFEDDTADELILVKDLAFTSFCEHHILPFIGVAHIAYLPNKRVLGVSKLARVLEIYARRLQIQERLTQQVTKALDDHLDPLGAACVVEARHLCMSCRGVNQPGATMVTSSLTGEFMDNFQTRAEFFNLIKGE